MNYTAAVLTVSDKGARGRREDTSGPAVRALLEENGWDVIYTAIIPDELEQIKSELIKCADELGINLVLTTGGTGFSPRDVTPEATLAAAEREAPGIPEAMRAESMKITPRGCLSRSAAGLRGRTLIVNLPGSEKAARENLLAVLPPLRHGVEMLLSGGSADCGTERPLEKPSMDAWLREAKSDPDAGKVGMYLTHNGVVRATAKAAARQGLKDTAPVRGMRFSHDAAKAEAVKEDAYRLPGVYYVRIWLNEGELEVGEDLMYVLAGGDTRPHTVDALQYIVERLKTECVTETEITQP